MACADWCHSLAATNSGVFPADQIDHAGIPEMTLQTEVNELCSIANALDISTADIEAAVFSHYGNHHAAMKVKHVLLGMPGRIRDHAAHLCVLVILLWSLYCLSASLYGISNKRKTVMQVLQAREICSANPTEGQSSGSTNFAVPSIPEAGEQGHLVSHVISTVQQHTPVLKKDTVLTTHSCSCDADSDADEFTVMEKRMWADVKKPTWEEGSHDSSSSVSTRVGRMYLPEYAQKVCSSPVHSQIASCHLSEGQWYDGAQGRIRR